MSHQIGDRRWTVRSARRRAFAPITAVVVAALLLAPPAAVTQTEVEPGFNLFSVEQDVEIGRRSAEEADRQLPILDKRAIRTYINQVGDRLEKATPGPDFPYQFKVVNVSDVNAFALPGGFLYLNRGLIDLAGSESELAGVMAHEMAHVALRHGTNQASKAYLAQAGFGLLGALLGEGASTDVIGAVGGFGLNALFLEFSRDDEEDADILGAQIMARAGYDPRGMIGMFRRMHRQSEHSHSAVAEFFASHPPYEERIETIERERGLLDVDRRPAVGGLASVQSRFDRMPPAPTMREVTDDGGNPGS